MVRIHLGLNKYLVRNRLTVRTSGSDPENLGSNPSSSVSLVLTAEQKMDKIFVPVKLVETRSSPTMLAAQRSVIVFTNLVARFFLGADKSSFSWEAQWPAAASYQALRCFVERNLPKRQQ